MARSNQRSGMPSDVRLSLLETDLDELEEAIDRLVKAIDGLKREIADRSDGVKRMFLGFVISLATASILLAINLIAGTVTG